MRKIMLLPAALMATACSNGAFTYGGLWVFTWGPLAQEEGTFTCEENFNEADCPEEDEPIEDSGLEIDFEQEFEGSPATTLVEVMEDEHGMIFFLISGRILEGAMTEDGSGVSAGWNGFGNTNRKTSFESSYLFETQQDFTSKVQLDLTMDMGTWETTGTIRQTIKTSVEITETDELDEGPISVGQINNTSGSTLEPDTETNGQFNFGQEDDCSGDTCEIKLASEVGASRTFMAYKLEDNGFPGAGSYPGFQNPEGGEDQFIGVLRSNFTF